VASGATTTLKHNTGITMANGVLTASTAKLNTFLYFTRSDGPSYIMIPDGKSLIINNGNSNGSAYAALSIDKTNVFSAYTATLGTSTYRWGSIYTQGASYIYSGHSRWTYDIYLRNYSGNTVGEMWYDSGDADNVTGG